MAQRLWHNRYGTTHMVCCAGFPTKAGAQPPTDGTIVMAQLVMAQ